MRGLVPPAGFEFRYDIALLQRSFPQLLPRLAPKGTFPGSRLSKYAVTPAGAPRLPTRRPSSRRPPGTCRRRPWRPGPGQHRLHGLGVVLLPADDLHRQRQHQVVPVVTVGGQPILGQLPSTARELYSFLAASLRASPEFHRVLSCPLRGRLPRAAAHTRR